MIDALALLVRPRVAVRVEVQQRKRPAVLSNGMLKSGDASSTPTETASVSFSATVTAATAADADSESLKSKIPGKLP